MAMQRWEPDREEWDDCSRAIANGIRRVSHGGLSDTEYDLAYGNALLRLVRHADPNPRLAFTMGQRACVDTIRTLLGRDPEAGNLRRRVERAEVDVPVEDDTSQVDEQIDLTFEWVEDEKIRELCRKVLSPAMEGREYQDIAGDLGVSPGRISQLRREIREHFIAEGYVSAGGDSLDTLARTRPAA